jgi:arabinofuranan 3-O-arabinosyltransferase
VSSPARRSVPRPRTALITGVVSILLTALALGTAGWLYVRYPGVLVSGVANTDPRGHVDFETFWRSTRALLEGADLYSTGSVLPNLNPPFLSLLLAPLGLLPVLPAYWVFTAVTILLVTGSVLLTTRELRLGRAVTVIAVLALLASSPLHGTLLLGQIYGLLQAGLTLAWLVQRRGRPLLSAALVGVTVAIKPSLAPLLLVPLVRRSWPDRRPALVTGLAAAGGVSLVGVLVAGPSSALEWLHLATGTPAPEVDANAALPGLVARLGGPGALGWLVTVAVVAGSLWWVRRASPSPGARPPGSVEPADAALFAVAAGCLLAAPIAWLNYEIMLLPGVLVLLRAGRWRVGAPLLALPIVPVAWGNLWQADPHTPAALAGRSLYCAVLLGFWVALVLFSRKQGPVGPDDLGGPGRAAETDAQPATPAGPGSPAAPDAVTAATSAREP